MKRIGLSLAGLVMAFLLAAPAYAQSPAGDQYGQPPSDEVIGVSPGDQPPPSGDELDDGAAGERPDDDLLGAPAAGAGGEPIAVAAAPAPADDSRVGGLPFTGSSALLIALVGLLLLAAGMWTAVILRSRERLRHRAGR